MLLVLAAGWTAPGADVAKFDPGTCTIQLLYPLVLLCSIMYPGFDRAFPSAPFIFRDFFVFIKRDLPASTYLLGFVTSLLPISTLFYEFKS